MLQVRQCVVVGCFVMADTWRAHAFDARIPTGFNHTNFDEDCVFRGKGRVWWGGVGRGGGGACARVRLCTRKSYCLRMTCWGMWLRLTGRFLQCFGLDVFFWLVSVHVSPPQYHRIHLYGEDVATALAVTHGPLLN
jgi:hypothetical protein